MLPTTGEHHRHGTENPAGTVPCTRGDELTQTVLTQAPETERVHERCHNHIQPGMGHQSLAGRGDRQDRKNWAILKHRKGAPLQLENNGFDTSIFPVQSTLSPL